MVCRLQVLGPTSDLDTSADVLRVEGKFAVCNESDRPEQGHTSPEGNLILFTKPSSLVKLVLPFPQAQMALDGWGAGKSNQIDALPTKLFIT